MPKITILIISHNHESYLNSLLLDISNFARYISEVIIVHNVPLKQKVLIPLKIKKKTLIIYNKKPFGLSKNINRSLKYLRSEFVAIINPDIKIKKNIFKEIINNFKNDKKLGLVSPLILNQYNEIQDTSRDYPSIINLIKREIFRVKVINNGNDWLAGMFSVYRTKILKKLKFDENFFLYCEDVDVSLRLVKNDYKFFLNKRINVTHLAQKNSRKNLIFTFYHLRSYLHLWKKYGFF